MLRKISVVITTTEASRIHREITGHQAHPLGAELLTEIAQLLVRQRFERGCVKHLAPVGQGAMDGVLAHQGFARAGGGTHHDGVALVQGVDRLELEAVEREGKQSLQRRHRSRPKP